MARPGSLMEDKVCVITGATSGIGEATALGLARMGATVVVIGRDNERATNTVTSIRQESGNQNVHFVLADLSVQAEVRQLAERLRGNFLQIDVLINNAGSIFMKRHLSADGIEMTFALNHLAYFLLTNLLLDRLTESAPARIINVASAAHADGSLDFDDLQGTARYGGLLAYGRSKLANLLFTYELARRLEGSAVTANALHPGFVATRLGSDNGSLFRLGNSIARLTALRPEMGARTSVYLASSPDVAEVTGKYFVNEQEVRSSDASYDKESARRLWEVSEELTVSKETGR